MPELIHRVLSSSWESLKELWRPFTIIFSTSRAGAFLAILMHWQFFILLLQNRPSHVFFITYLAFFFHHVRFVNFFIQLAHLTMNSVLVIWFCREAQIREVSETTNSRVAWYSILSLGICIMVSVAQLWYLTCFFQKKKLI